MAEVIGPYAGEPKPLRIEDMTLRDYFAAQALASLPVWFASASAPDNGEMAKAAYGIADAMLAARQ